MPEEELHNVMLIVLSSMGIGFALVGLLLIKFPPKTINGLYGYRTSRSMQSQEAWDFSQRYSSKIMVILGVVFGILGVLSLKIPVDDITASIISVFIVVAGTFIMFYKTERELRKRFDE